MTALTVHIDADLTPRQQLGLEGEAGRLHVPTRTIIDRILGGDLRVQAAKADLENAATHALRRCGDKWAPQAGNRRGER